MQSIFKIKLLYILEKLNIITHEGGLTIESRNKIIIGVCVGVGSAIIVGLGIFFLVKYLAAKKAIAVSQNVTQMKALDGKGSEAIVL